MADLKITRRMGFAVALLVYAVDQFVKAIIIHGVALPVWPPVG